MKPLGIAMLLAPVIVMTIFGVRELGWRMFSALMLCGVGVVAWYAFAIWLQL